MYPNVCSLTATCYNSEIIENYFKELNMRTNVLAKIFLKLNKVRFDIFTISIPQGNCHLPNRYMKKDNYAILLYF